MSKPRREGAAPLQIRASAWVHELLEERTAVQGVQAWMVVEQLMLAGLDAQERSKKGAREEEAEPGAVVVTSPRDQFHAFHKAAVFLDIAFKNDLHVFLATIRKLHDEKKSLTVKDWKQWTKMQMVPAPYVQTLFRLFYVLDGMMRAEEPMKSMMRRSSASAAVTIASKG